MIFIRALKCPFVLADQTTTTTTVVTTVVVAAVVVPARRSSAGAVAGRGAWRLRPSGRGTRGAGGSWQCGDGGGG